ncbi:MAG: hypothetical protein ABI681_02525 [Gemmatimonadales bacterium]
MRLTHFTFLRALAFVSLAIAPLPTAKAQARSVLLVETARNATEPYTDRAVAIAAGYRRVGRDFPSMGEHWLSPRLIVEGVFDVSRPAVLTYVTIEGRPTLTGVVYAIPLAPGESPPEAFGPDALWHEHNGTIDEEGLLAEHHTMHTSATGTRVAFLHAWIRIPSSDGIFAAENWAIPFLRLHLPPPDHFPIGAARALSLLSGGKAFFLDLAGSSAAPTVSASLDQCSAIAGKIVSAARSAHRTLTVDDLRELDAAWQSAMTAIAGSVKAEIAQRLNGGVPPHVH